jgi:DNA-binding CsgD family transcriptional regulator
MATAGNPLAIRVLLRDLASEGIRPTAAAAPALAQHAPRAIQHRVLATLEPLGEPALQLARALAVVGDGSDLHVLAGVSELGPDRASEIADRLAAADLLSTEHPPRFLHPLLRAAVYDSIPVGARSRLHRRAADLLVARGASAEAVAAHLLRCQPDDAPDTLERLRTAARAAVGRRAPDAAVVYLRRALIGCVDGPARVTLLAELGGAERLTGDSAAADHLQEAVDGCSDPLTRGRLRNELADVVRALGDRRMSMQLRLQAIGELADADPEASERIEVTMSIPLATSRVAPAGIDPSARLYAIAAGNSPAARPARIALAWLMALRAAPTESVLSHLDSALEARTFLAQETSDSPAALWVAMALLCTDELVRAVAWTQKMQSDATARGSTVGFAVGLVLGAVAAHRSGLLADAEAGLQAALDISRAPDLGSTLGAAMRAANLLELGRPEAALATVERLRAEPRMDIYGTLVLVYRGRVLCASGRKDEGIAALRACGEIASEVGVLNPILLPWRSDLALNLPSEAREEARSLAAGELELAHGMRVPRAIGVALRAVAALERDAAAVNLLREAVAVLETSPSVLELARAQLDLGAALRRLGHRVEAREPLLQALEIATRCGAVPLAERAREESLLAGARPRRPRLRGIDALTPAELRVARKAAEGLSNREIAQALFITTKTVTDHLGSSYGKLQITSRGELAAALAPDGA